jgi:hypothetical protein
VTHHIRTGKPASLLYIAISFGQKDIAEWLVDLDCGFRWTHKSCNRDLFFAACDGGQLGMITFLIEKGLPVEQLTSIGKNGVNCMFAACAAGHLDVLLFCLMQGMDPTAEVKGRSCLAAACAGGSSIIVSALLAIDGVWDSATLTVSSLDLTVPSQLALCPLVAAAAGGHLSVCAILLLKDSHKSLVQHALNAAWAKERIGVARLLIESGGKPAKAERARYPAILAQNQARMRKDVWPAKDDPVPEALRQ